ncbi:hypothetical protein [Streptomyces sp. NPDC058657]|uniref:hypothetical protein n=1 Tax=unclassified Streptomyces TaxID=2593676 RepID=UPI00365329C7
MPDRPARHLPARAAHHARSVRRRRVPGDRQRHPTVFVEPGCCNGLETWPDWLEVLNGTGCSSFGHDPSSITERLGDIVRLTLDAHETDSSPVIELSVDRIRRLVAGARQDVQDFLGLAGFWAEQHLPAHAAAVTAALARALDLAPAP